jgi:hypothetical protein
LVEFLSFLDAAGVEGDDVGLVVGMDMDLDVDIVLVQTAAVFGPGSVS